jgi:hypothetical protein
MVRYWTGFTPYVHRLSGGYRTHLYGLAPETKRLLRDYHPLHPTQPIFNLGEDNPELSEEDISLISGSKTLSTEKGNEKIFLALILQAVERTENTFQHCGIAQVPTAEDHAEKGMDVIYIWFAK